MRTESLSRLQEAVKVADAASSSLPNVHKQLIAFEVILTHLVESEQTPAPSAARGSHAEAVVPSAMPAGKPRGHDGRRPGPTAWLRELVEEGYFGQERTLSDVVAKFAERGHVLKSKDLTGQIEQLLTQKVLRRQPKASPSGGRDIWYYTNW